MPRSGGGGQGPGPTAAPAPDALCRGKSNLGRWGTTSPSPTAAASLCTARLAPGTPLQHTLNLKHVQSPLILTRAFKRRMCLKARPDWSSAAWQDQISLSLKMIQKSEPLGMKCNYKELYSNAMLLSSDFVRNDWKDFLTRSEFTITSKIKCVYTHIFPVSAFLQPYTSPNPPLPIILCTLKSFMVSCKRKKTKRNQTSFFSIKKSYCKNIWITY